MNKTQQLLIALMCGMSPDHPMLKGITWDKALGASLLETAQLDKNALFAASEGGHSFFEFKETWQAARELFDRLAAQGTKVTPADLLKPIIGDKTIAQMAHTCGALPVLFAPDLWKGHEREMRMLWFSINKDLRNKNTFTEICRDLAKFEGRELREDQLERMGISYAQLRSALTGSNLDGLVKKMAEHGEHLRADDLMLVDDWGDSAYDNKSNWSGFDAVVEELARNGEYLSAVHFTARFGGRKSILDYALQWDMEAKIFNPALWQGRMGEMAALYECVPEDKRKKIDIYGIVQGVHDATFGNIQIDEHFSIGDLLVDHDIGEGRTLRLLGLNSIWAKMDEIAPVLAAKKQHIKLADLLHTSGVMGESCLLQIVRGGNLAKIMDMIEQGGERLDSVLLLAKDEKDTDGKSLLDVIVETKQHGALFNASHWVGRGQDMMKLWDAMPADARKDVDFRAVHGELNLLSLRGKFANRMAGPRLG